MTTRHSLLLYSWRIWGMHTHAPRVLFKPLGPGLALHSWQVGSSHLNHHTPNCPNVSLSKTDIPGISFPNILLPFLLSSPPPSLPEISTVAAGAFDCNFGLASALNFPSVLSCANSSLLFWFCFQFTYSMDEVFKKLINYFAGWPHGLVIKGVRFQDQQLA